MTTAPTPMRERHAPHIPFVLGVIAGAAAAATLALLIQHDVFQSPSSSSTLHGSGVAATQSRELGAFHAVDFAGSNMVTVRLGSKQTVTVRADDNLIDRVTTRVVAGTLVIANRGSFTTESPMSVAVTVPSLKASTLSGSGIVNLENVKASQLTVSLSGSGVIRASGTANRLDVRLGGSGDAQLGGLVARDAQATVNGSGRIVVNATNRLHAAVAGNGAIVYTGSPTLVTTDVTGSGAVVRG
jgi:hypothetical protein